MTDMQRDVGSEWDQAQHELDEALRETGGTVGWICDPSALTPEVMRAVAESLREISHQEQHRAHTEGD